MSNNNRERLFNSSGPPPQALSGQLSIQDLMGIYGFLNSITTPSEKIIEAKNNMENIILEFSQSLGARPHGQAN